MPCSECNAKVNCLATTSGPVSMGNVWYEEDVGWHCHFPEGFEHIQMFECANGHKRVEKWTPSCETCSQKSK